MTEPVPGQTPEPPEAAEPLAAGPDPTEPTGAEAAGAGTAEPNDPAAPDAGPANPFGANPQELFGSLSLTDIEADIDRLMNDKMSELDGMLAGLEELVQRLEGEITNLEPPPDAADTP